MIGVAIGERKIVNRKHAIIYKILFSFLSRNPVAMKEKLNK